MSTLTLRSSAAAPPVDEEVATLSLTSGAGGTLPWTFGHAFAKGDVPSGSYITTDASSSQADVRNRWDDGSAKYAVLSGISTFTADVAKAIVISSTGSAPGGSDVAEPTTLDVEVVFTGDVTGTYTLQSCLGVDRSTWSLADAGRVRQFLGPVMSEFHYYRPTTDAHVTVWFFVRKYSDGAVEVETVVENGWINVSSPNVKSYGVSVDIDGSSVYSGSLTHYHHTRWSRVDWIGTDPDLTPEHDDAYLRASKLVPNYGYTSPTAAAFTGLASAINPAPFALGNWSTDMGDTGYQPAIGLLPQWESVYCTSADSRAYAATISNNRGSGRWPIHYRDEDTGRPALWSDYPALTLTSGWGTPPPSPSGGGPTWDIPHHPSNGYLAYLIEGRWTALESLQFCASFAILDSNQDTRQSGGVLACINSPMTTRGAAWSWRTVGQAAAISPSTLSGADAAVQESYADSIDNLATWAKARYIDGSTYSGAHQNTIGWLGQYDNYTGAPIPADEWWGGSWMVQFQSTALGHISDLEIENLTTPENLAAIRDHSYDNCLLQLAADDTNWNFRRGAVFDRPYLKSSSGPATPVFMTPAEAFTSYKSVKSISGLSANSGDSLKRHSSDTDMGTGDSSNDGSGFWAVALGALAMAVDHGKSGASTKYSLVTAASNYDPATHGAHDIPQWAIVPRA